MRKTLTLTIAGSLIAATLAGCANDGMGRKEAGGTAIGAGTGALLGALAGGHGGERVAWTLFGALAGGMVGNSVGRSLDRADQAAIERTNYHAMEYGKSGHAETWYNPDSGNRGSVTPVRTYQSREGQYCREFNQTVEIGGKREEAYGTACRQPDGTWKIING